MTKATAYHRPATVDEAVALLSEPGRVVLAGGTAVNDRTVGIPGLDPGETSVEVVDIQALDLDGIDGDAGELTIGAATTLQALVDSDAVPDLIRELARAELPSTLRNSATIGGLVAAGQGESPLQAALLVHGAGATRVGPNDELLTAVSISTGGVGAWSGTGRTPADTPIVSAVGRKDADGVIHLALTGVAAAPMLVDSADPTGGLAPPADFRGSTEYRIELARIHSQRVLAELAAD